MLALVSGGYLWVGCGVMNINLDWTFGDRLRKIRRSLHLSTRDFAAAVGVTHSSLTQYETDRMQPRNIVGFARRVEGVTGVPAAWLLGLDSKAPDVDDGPAVRAA